MRILFIFIFIVFQNFKLSAQNVGVHYIDFPFQNPVGNNNNPLTKNFIISKRIKEVLYVLEVRKDSLTNKETSVDSLFFYFNKNGYLDSFQSKTRKLQIFYNEFNEIDSVTDVLTYDTSFVYEKRYHYYSTNSGSVCIYHSNLNEEDTLWFNPNNILIRKVSINKSNKEIIEIVPKKNEASRTVFKSGKKYFEVKSRWVVENGIPTRFHSSTKHFIYSATSSPDYSGYFEVDKEGNAILPRNYLSFCSSFSKCNHNTFFGFQYPKAFYLPQSTSWYFWNETFDQNYIEFRRESVFLKRGDNWGKN